MRPLALFLASSAVAGFLCACRSGPSVEDSSNGVVAYFGSGTTSSPDPAFAPRQVYSGIFSSNFEISWFWPEEIPAETWWVSGGDLRRLNHFLRWHPAFSFHTPSQAYVFVRWRGTVSQKGHYGHDDRAVRVFTVKEILSVREVRPEDRP